MKVFSTFFVCLATFMILCALFTGSEARDNPEGQPPSPSFSKMLDDPEQPDAPKRVGFRARRQIPDMPSPPMPDDMPMPPGGK